MDPIRTIMTLVDEHKTTSQKACTSKYVIISSACMPRAIPCVIITYLTSQTIISY